MCRSPAASRASPRASSIPPVTKWNVVPPCISTGSRGRWPSTKTGAWYGGSAPHQPCQSRSHSPRSGPNMWRPMMYAPACTIASRSASLASGCSNIQRCNRSAPLPSGFSRLWSGPAENPSSETPLSQVTFVMVAPSDRGAVPLRRSHACNLDITHHVGMSTGLELRHLRAFVAVAEELHFTRAAARLHLAQQALSTQIRQLEDELGTPLFHRTTRRVELTDAGRTLLLHAGPILASVSAAFQQTQRAGSGELGTLSIASAPTVAEETLPPLIAAVHDRLPDVRVRTCEMWQAEEGRAGAGRRLALGPGPAPAPPAPPG